MVTSRSRWASARSWYQTALAMLCSVSARASAMTCGSSFRRSNGVISEAETEVMASRALRAANFIMCFIVLQFEMGPAERSAVSTRRLQWNL
eukprot:9476477-Pyramimonas_sp.AAC.1